MQKIGSGESLIPLVPFCSRSSRRIVRSTRIRSSKIFNPGIHPAGSSPSQNHFARESYRFPQVRVQIVEGTIKVNASLIERLTRPGTTHAQSHDFYRPPANKRDRIAVVPRPMASRLPPVSWGRGVVPIPVLQFVLH